MFVCVQVSAFSTWEKELHKIVFDKRYLLLTSKERKQVFDQYVKERADEERREKRSKMKERKEQFRQLLESSKLHGKFVTQTHTHASPSCYYFQHTVFRIVLGLRSTTSRRNTARTSGTVVWTSCAIARTCSRSL